MGKTPVAILSTETFDATTVDIGSVRFAGAMVSVKKNGEYHASYEDVNDDGLIDLVLHFDMEHHFKQSKPFTAFGTETETSAYTLVNADASWTLPVSNHELTLFLRAVNLLDEEARVSTSFRKDVAPLPGRGLTLGIRHEF